MVCKKCGSSNVEVRAENINTGAVVKDVSIVTKLCRLTLIIFTCGLWLLVPKKKGTHKAKNKLVKICMCKECGRVWQE